MLVRILLGSAFFFCIGSSSLWAKTITTGSLIEEMVDLHRLADFPDPFYKTVQFSSYDRQTSVPGGPGWFANSDGFGSEPIPGCVEVLREPTGGKPGEYLLCDIQQPGAIVRMWSAAIEGDIRMFLDDATDPVYTGPAKEFLQRVYDRFADIQQLERASFEGTFHQRDACYDPIPFQKRCRIVWTGDHRRIHFYHIQVRLYETGTKINTFEPEDLISYWNQIERVSSILARPNERWPYTSKEKPVAIAVTLQPTEVRTVLVLDEPGAIERLTLKVRADDIDRALRQTVMQIRCDGFPWGQVQSPLGDFFGSGPGINPCDTVPFTVEPDGTMSCRFVMPFKDELQITLENRGEQTVTVTGSTLPMKYRWNDATSMHFRAKWRVDHDLVAHGNPAQDLPFLIANGRGVYVGTTSILLNPNNVPMSWGNWWGEGDEKIFIDEDTTPSTVGTGSEDYYNYSWSAADIFNYPYCGQPRNDGPGNRGFVTNFRWHILDPLPFRSRIGFFMELFNHERTEQVSYARIGYHYARPGLWDDHVLITDEDVRPLELPACWQPLALSGAKGSIFYQAEQLIEGEPSIRMIKNNLWSDGDYLSWRPNRKGEELVLSIPVMQRGKHSLHITAAMTPDSGCFTTELDGKAVSFGGDNGTIDLAVPYRTLSRTFSTESMDLAQGEHRLVIRYAGQRRQGKAEEIGLDFIWVQRLESQ